MSKTVTVTVESDETPSRKVVFTLTYPGDDTMEVNMILEPGVHVDEKAEYLNIAGLILNAIKEA